MQLSQKQKTFSKFVKAIVKSKLNFPHFEKRSSSELMYLRNYALPNQWLNNCLKIPF